ncbi:aminoacyl--tRNA ligase-related protein [Actinoalloteichus caeruleus]|uniref:Serine--tRNA ligase n=1 Tax=Actinoalloteichus caeruleus DSM 43889 TaxID=1120930 RepID=A0ABT1JBQ8_ACTCY|nr:aminoacyl--tRNA ligase-related protein [Actinoalloteichus caeruleus]MCP2329937.1 seryl-tRNA synthetase [Actinoalloteichus caeruleus DSM 43889]
MYDPGELLDPAAGASWRLARRGWLVDRAALRALVVKRDEAVRRAAVSADRRTRVSARVRAAARAGADLAALRSEARGLKEGERAARSAALAASERLAAFLLDVPATPDDRVPDGATEECAVELRRWSAPGAGLRAETTTAERPGGRTPADPGRTSVTRARLERVVGGFLLDLHGTRHGYDEVSLPLLVEPEMSHRGPRGPAAPASLVGLTSAQGTRYVAPGGDIGMTLVHAGRSLPVERLPLAHVALSPQLGVDDLRSPGGGGASQPGVGQTTTVDLLRVCLPERLDVEFRRLVAHAEECLRHLELSHRVLLVPAGDLGFAARRAVRIQVWSPRRRRYHDLTTISDCGTFLARRTNTRVRPREGGRQYAGIVHGAALPVGPTVTALLEQHGRTDGLVRVPAALVGGLVGRRLLAVV